ncbi:MAG: F0F1 ATP synthase subunit B [Candidatus Eisenbacteria bacterium]|uniref:ATP synthase subunit b n=1 Tax=Eiseniibacteriota bacterium TaxID=2212470 RepID=A0A948RXW5_UNCEI|nr:F0F1 ATP synthase subunit B [Candidatus Eisenbacteria bacterium]MBU1949991.1 F0F1 ATP synthase subunit B [Candidatus Eisenbacteria bacterium]MBU2691092.1 F0F1 ATP synthase subunit B [Candidatus Eisenbacteria bacterium]
MDLVWSEVVTQIIGFILAVWILHKFAWKPILGLLDSRRRGIENAQQEIKEQREEVAGQKAHYEQELRNIEARARERIQEAVREANDIAARIREQAQEERRQRLSRAEDEVARIQESATEEVRRQTVNLAVAAAEKTIREHLDDERHRKLIREFIDKVETAS